jgi:hypothetical protein
MIAAGRKPKIVYHVVRNTISEGAEMAEKLAQKGASGRARGLSNSRAPGVYASFEASPAEPLIGATITGVDLTAPIPAEQVDDLNHALARHNVLFFRDQPQLSPEQQVAFARNFGELLG